MKSTIKYLVLCCLFINGISCFAQLSQVQTQQIDSIFLSWNQPNHPGGSIGVMQNGEIIYSKAFGLASMEYLVPNTPNTVYNIASVSKQFTSMGILLLEKAGKLSIDEDIRTYLPELPDFGEKITLRHCMHHTSGMRSLHAMLAMAGWRDDDSRTNEDLFRFMKNQKELNFKPGSEYLYCNTGYMLMADIIEKTTGEKFVPWMEQNVFKPLGMFDTYVEDQYNRIVPNNATSYDGNAKSGFERSTEFWGYVGSGNMHSTTQDLLKWLENFHHPKTGWETVFKRMQTIDTLNNGETLDYAFGIGINEYKGEKKVGHGGSIGGFRSNIATFPEHQLNVVLLTNLSSANAGRKMNEITEIILNKSADKPKVKKDMGVKKAPQFLVLSQQELQSYSGTYYSPELDTHYHFKMMENGLEGNHTRHGNFDIKIVEKDKLEADLLLFKDIKIKRKENGEIEGIFVSNGRVRNMWFNKTH